MQKRGEGGGEIIERRSLKEWGCDDTTEFSEYNDYNRENLNCRGLKVTQRQEKLRVIQQR